MRNRIAILLFVVVFLFALTTALFVKSYYDRRNKDDLNGLYEPKNTGLVFTQASKQSEVYEPQEAPKLLWDIPLDEHLQRYIVEVCEWYNVAPELAIAVIYCESNFDTTASGGLMGIIEWANADRMERLGADDLQNPFGGAFERVRRKPRNVAHVLQRRTRRRESDMV